MLIFRLLPPGRCAVQQDTIVDFELAESIFKGPRAAEQSGKKGDSGFRHIILVILAIIGKVSEGVLNRANFIVVFV